MPELERDTITFICTGNVCRSPMAGALVAHALAAESPPLNQLKVATAGVSAREGEPPSTNSVRALQRVGLDLQRHRSRRITQKLIDRSLALFCMTESHRAMLMAEFDLENSRLYLMREFLESGEREIPDPFGLDFSAYVTARDSMVEAVPPLLRELRRLLENPDLTQ